MTECTPRTSARFCRSTNLSETSVSKSVGFVASQRRLRSHWLAVRFLQYAQRLQRNGCPSPKRYQDPLMRRKEAPRSKAMPTTKNHSYARLVTMDSLSPRAVSPHPGWL